MRYPYERFLRFLVSRKADVNAALRRIGLPTVGGLWTANCRQSFRDSAPGPIVSYLDTDGAEVPGEMAGWARQQGFGELWEAQSGSTPADLDLAIQLFSGARSRCRLALFLFARATPAEVCGLVAEQLNHELTPTALALYRRLFWDPDLVSRSHWDKFLEAVETKEERHYVALGLSQPSLEKIRMVLGGKLQIEPDDVLRRLMESSLEQYESALRQPIPGMDAIKWGEMAKSAAVALSQQAPKKAVENEAPTDFSGLFTVQVTKTRHVTLAELQGQDGD